VIKVEIYAIYTALLSLCIGIIGFFVKRAFTQLDKKADKDALNEARNDVKIRGL
jgi:hypothetical protein